MKQYKQLTEYERGKIEAYLAEGYGISDIAKKLVRHRSTISRELKRHKAPNGYFARDANYRYINNRRRCRKRKKMDKSCVRGYVINRLMMGWSPEEISGRMKIRCREDYVSKETIYNWIYNDEWSKRMCWYQYLRYGRKVRRKQNGRRVHKHKIPNRVSIHKRPKVVEKRTEFGHWEGDSVLYVNKYAINTLNELKTGLVEFTKLRRKTSSLTARAMLKKLSIYRSKTLTLDNGSEFVRHEEVSKGLGTRVYFCDPYSSWQRGANENVNMLLRGYLPKRSDIAKLTQKELDEIAYELNNRPRKRLCYKTPLEVYNEELSKLSNSEPTVALESGI